MNVSKALTLSVLTAMLGVCGKVQAQENSSEQNLPYGRYTCKQGYVWREAYPGDVVCVTSSTRRQAAYDNTQASRRIDPKGGPYGALTCKQGYVWREANAEDRVCVLPQVRTQTTEDNAQASSRWVIP